MVANVRARIVSVRTVFCVLIVVCAWLKPVDTGTHSHNWMETFEAEETPVTESSLEDAGEEGLREEGLRKTDQDEDAALEKSGSKDDEGFDEDDDKVEFMAVISRQPRHENPQAPCRRHHQGLVKFDAITPTSHLFSLPTSAFTVPYHGLYIFSLKFQFRQPHDNKLNDVSILTEEGQTVCSVSSQNGDEASENRARLESSAINTEENVDNRDDLSSAKWTFDAGRNRIDSEWFKPPTSAWHENLRTNDVEGFCEGLKHLRQGQRVFVRFGELKNGDRGDNVDATVDDNVNEDADFCDLVSGYFSGSLLAKDLEY